MYSDTGTGESAQPGVLTELSECETSLPDCGAGFTDACDPISHLFRLQLLYSGRPGERIAVDTVGDAADYGIRLANGNAAKLAARGEHTAECHAYDPLAMMSGTGEEFANRNMMMDGKAVRMAKREGRPQPATATAPS